MCNFKQILSGFILLTWVSPHFAMASDPETFGALQSGNTALITLRDRVATMSERSQIRLAYRLYQLGFKALHRLEKMSDEKFDRRMNHLAAPAKIESDGTENEEASPIDAGLNAELNQILPSTPAADSAELQTMNRSTAVTQLRMTLNAFGGNQQLSPQEFESHILSDEFEKTFNGEKALDRSPSAARILVKAVVILLAVVGLMVVFSWVITAIAVLLSPIVILTLYLIPGLFFGWIGIQIWIRL
jgi:ABC-type multidrug transport system fused ATPase/permease subunit